jgi:hypothetical protein
MANRPERLAQAAAWQRAVVLVGGRNDSEVDVALEPQVLEAVVEHVDGGAEAALGEGAGPEAIRADEDAGPGDAPGQHQRLVAGPGQVGQGADAVADDRDAVGRIGAAVAAGEDRRPLAGLDQQPGQARHDRRLAAAAAGDVADRDHRPGQAPGPSRLRIAPPAPGGDPGVERPRPRTFSIDKIGRSRERSGVDLAHGVTAGASGTASPPRACPWGRAAAARR